MVGELVHVTMKILAMWVLMFILCSSSFVKSVFGDNNIVCPQFCTCTKQNGRALSADTKLFKLKCGSREKVLLTIEDLDFTNFVKDSDVIILDLSDNNLTSFSLKSLRVPNLQKLDLTNNSISKIEDGAFKNAPYLRRLDLADNRLRRINRNMFENLHSLERLRLSQNFLTQIKEGTFDELVSLKQIDLSDNPLTCDCGLWWMLEWARNTSVKFPILPTCANPPSLRGLPLRKVKASSKCTWPRSEYDWSDLELHPSINQVVFEGDSLMLQCRSLSPEVSADDSVSWIWTDRDPSETFQGTIEVHNKHLKDNGFIESELVINQLQANHSGQWRCQLLSHDGNYTIGISIIVITNQTVYCPVKVTSDNKGVYTWPRTVAGHTVQLPCALDAPGTQASFHCAANGRWDALFTDNCPFASETTRILEQFSKLNLSSSGGSVAESLRRLHNFTFDNKTHLDDKEDIGFIATTVENYLHHVPREHELADLLVEIVDSVTKQRLDLLTDAQQSFNACSRLVSAVETITQLSPTFHASKDQIAVQDFVINRLFHGVTCSWYSLNGVLTDFLCFVTNNTAFIGTKDKVVEASIHVPSRLFELLQEQGTPSITGKHLQVSMYRSGALFPQLIPNSSQQVSSYVLGAKLIGMSVEQLNEPVFVMLRAPLTGSSRPAWWHLPTLSWRYDGCHFYDYVQGLLVFQCDRLGYFALLEDNAALISANIREPQAKSRLTHPAVFVGTFVGCTCLLVTTVTYVVCSSSIQMPSKAKHSLSNTWLAITALAMLFSLGIYQTEDLVTCKIIGLLIHYFTLCSLFWMAVTINGMYKRMTKTDTPAAVEEEEPVVVGQPLVGLYLVGWGIAALLTGLSGAVNLSHYAAPTHCSLGPGPGITALLVPCGALILYFLVRAMMVRCAADSIDSNTHLSEGTQATDLELLDNTPVPLERSSLHSAVTPSSQADDLEHLPMVQLKASLIVLTLFLSMWISAALVVTKPFNIYYEECIFSVVFTLLIALLGVFVFFFHCFSRNDVRIGWFAVKPCFRTRNVSDSRAGLPPVVSSSDSLNSSSGLKSAAVTLNSSPPQGVTKNASPGNVNLVMLHRRQYYTNDLTNSGNEAEVFYNPHQSGVARKFFKKQRRKQNNLGTRRSGDGNGSPSPFIGGAKVNNTNFHIEYLDERPSSNPNILRREAPIERLVIGAEGSQPILNNDGSLRLGYSMEDQVLSEGSIVDTDCGRDLSAKQSCGSSHIAVSISDQSDGSHLYATIDPPSPFHKRRRLRHNYNSDSDADKKETCV